MNHINTNMIASSLLPRFWLFYFAISIAVIGGIIGYGICVPFYLVGYVFKPSRRLADRILCRGIRLLMDVQPWFTGSFDMTLPTRSSSQGLLLISNHRSTLDAFILLSRVEGIRIFTKKSLLLIPGIGFMMRMTRQIPAKRGQIDSLIEAMEIVRERLRGGEVVHVFAEMTRCSEGFPGVQKFSSYPFLIAFQEKVTIVPIVFFETDRVWPKGISGLRFRHPVKVQTLAPIDSGQFASVEMLKAEVCRVITKSVQGNSDDYSPVPLHSHIQQ